MSTFAGGIPLEALFDPVNDALAGYTAVAGAHKLEFDLTGAGELKPVPDSETIAYSTTNVEYLGSTAAQLVVVALAPGGGTGSEDTHRLSELRIGSSYPKDPHIVPRSREETDSEIYLPLVSFQPGAPDSPRLFAGHLRILSFQDDGVMQTAEAGQSFRQFRAAMDGRVQAEPTARLTVGYRDRFAAYDRYGDYFGGDHALYNPVELNTVQVFGLIALDHYASWQLGLVKDLQATAATRPHHHLTI